MNLKRVRTVAVGAITFAILGLIALAVFGPNGGGNTQALPGGFQALVPNREATVPRQSEVGVRIERGFDAQLIVNGVTISGLQKVDDQTGELVDDGLIKNLESGYVTYVPKVGGLLESLAKGRNCVEAVVWPLDEGISAASKFTWCFSAV